VVAVVDTVVAAAVAVNVPGMLEKWELRPVHHTQKDLPLAIGQGVPVAASAVELMDRRQVVQHYQPVVRQDMPRWDSRQEPTLRCQPLQTDCLWTQVQMIPEAWRQNRHLHYSPLKDRSRASSWNVGLSWDFRSCLVHDYCQSNNYCNRRYHRFGAVHRSRWIPFEVYFVTFSIPLAVVARGVP